MLFRSNTTQIIAFTPSARTSQSTLSNLTVQDDYIYYPKNGLMNIDHSRLYLNPSDTFSALPVFNSSEDPLIVNDSINLNKDSFNYISWDGSTASNTEKSYFDDIKIYLKGNEDVNQVFYIKDDTEIIINDFADKLDKARKEYYFIKDNENVNRNVFIKIRNGSSTFTLPREKQDFKLTVKKNTDSSVQYSILYPSNEPFFEITDSLEQMVLITSDLFNYIDLAYLESRIPKNAFVYFINKSSHPVYFYKGSTSNTKSTLSQNQIARASIVTIGSSQGIKIDIINNASNHFEFIVDPSQHLSDSINILNLDFCGTEVKFPEISNFVGKDLFLLCKNRTTPNTINSNNITFSAGLIEDNLLSTNSISLRAYKKSVSDKQPTLERTPFIDRSANISIQPLLNNDIKIIDDLTEYYYINDSSSSLNQFALRDYYDRQTKFNGKIFLQSKSGPFKISSYDDNHFFNTSSQNLNKSFSNSLSFDYNPDKYEIGRAHV